MKKIKFVLVAFPIMFVMLLLPSCEKDELLTIQKRLNHGETPFEIYLSDNALLEELYGLTYQGGLIFYLDTIDGTGFVAAPFDQSFATWGCFGTDLTTVPNGEWLPGSPTNLPRPIGAGVEIGAGRLNTMGIISECTEAGTAARVCNDLVEGGYNDWFLPSTLELDAMYTNLHLNNLGRFVYEWRSYWSSTESSAGYGWTQNFKGPRQDHGWSSSHKDNTERVRAVREF